MLDTMKLVSTNIKNIRSQGLYRERIATIKNDGYALYRGKYCVDFSSNDYLGLRQHPAIKKKFSDSAMQYGFGSGSSAMVSGFSKETEHLEREFAQFVRYPRVLFFQSGYHANLAVMSVLCSRFQVVFADKWVHASIVDGLRLSSGQFKRFPHQDFEALIRLKQSCHHSSYCITEGVFSMQGDITNLNNLYHMTENKLDIIVDDAHGFGVLGVNGRGCIDYHQLTHQQVPVCIIPCGKAMAGIGAMVCATEEIIEKLLQFSRSYIYSTALPPAIASTLRTSLAILSTEDALRDQLFENIRFFNHLCHALDIKIISADLTPIRSIIIGSNAKTIKAQKSLLAKGFWVSCIRPPTVPDKTSRLRVSLSAIHTKQQIQTLVSTLSACL